MKSIKYLLLAIIGCLLLQCKKSNTDVPPPKVITGVYFPDVSIVKGGIVDHSDNMTTYGHVWDTIPAPEVDDGTSEQSQDSYQGFNGDTLEVISEVDFTEGITYYIRGYAQDKFGDVFYGSYEIIYDPTNPANNPTACFETNTTVCEVGSCTINFDADCSTPNSTFISSYNWDFDGDGIFDTTGSDEQAVAHTYDSADTYSAILQIITITGVGSRDTIDIQVNASNTLVACFVVTKDACDIDDCAIGFDASCSQNETKYRWDFNGDGVSDLSGQDVTSYNYTTPGTYDVRLIVEDNDENADTAFQTIQVYDITVDFSIPSGTFYENCDVVQFTNNSIGATSYLWNFGDGNTSTDENPTHFYENSGTYTVTLTAIIGGFEVESMQNITISPTVKFEKISDIGEHDMYQGVIALSDGSYVMAGSTDGMGGSSSVYLIKTDANGNVNWERTFGGSSWGEANSIISTPDGGYAIAGYLLDNIYLIKTDAGGNWQWEETFDNSGIDIAYSIASTPDGGYVIAGETLENGWHDVYLIKTDASGTMEWDNNFGGSDNDKAHSVISAPNGGYVIAGYRSNQGAGETDVYIIKTYPNGNLHWEKTFGGSSWDGANSIISAPDGGYIIVGYTSSQGAGSSDVYLIKIDANGEWEWDRTYGGSGSESASSVVSTPDGGYVIIGQTNNQGNYDVYLIKTDSMGMMQWEKTYGGGGGDYGNSIKTTNDCGYVIVGRHNNTNYNFYLIKTDSEGNAQ